MLASGTRLGPYEIVSILGAGGMGEVYLARDTRLSRQVAIKVLPERLSASVDARQRFEREAHAISQLSHPNICTLYDVGTAVLPRVGAAAPLPPGVGAPTTPHPDAANGSRSAGDGSLSYLVMEYLAGESLAQRVERGPLPFAEVLRHGIEIASALDRAHRAGIVHRDLKPGNVMLTGAGAKLLDFGLAKAFVPNGPLAVDTLDTAAPPLTRDGEIQGTLAYMAPEQLQGLAVDARSDVFALGALLFEMATARRAFAGGDHASVIGAIMAGDLPEFSGDARALPPAFERLVRTCLAKDPALRWQAARDIALHLGAIHELQGPAATPPRAPLAWLPWTLAALALTAAAWLWRSAGAPPPEAPNVQFTVSPPAGSSFAVFAEARSFALSPDGRQLAFVATDATSRQIYVRPMASLDARPLAGTEGAQSLAWSPDSRRLAYFTSNRLLRVDIDQGATPVPITDISPGTGYSASWGANGRIVYGPVSGEKILAVSTSDGTSEVLLQADVARGDARFNWPSFLPDGERFVYLAHAVDNRKELREYRPGGESRVLAALESDVRVLGNGNILYVRDSTLLMQPYDIDKATLLGEPHPLATDVGYFLTTGFAAFSASHNGLIAYQGGSASSRLIWFDRAGNAGEALGSDGLYQDLEFSPDGTRLLFDRIQPGPNTFDVWMHELGSAGETRVSASRDTEISGAWLPDMHALIYAANTGGGPRLRLLDLTTSTDRELLPGRGFQRPQDVSPDGKVLAFIERAFDGAGQFRAWTLELDGEPAPRPLYPSEFQQSAVRFSPDGRHVAFIANDTGRRELYVAPFPGPGAKVRISANGALQVRWPRRSGEILYVSADNKLMAVPVTTGVTLELGTAIELFALPTRGWMNFDSTPDGQRLLAIVPQTDIGSLPLTVITGTDEQPVQ